MAVGPRPHVVVRRLPRVRRQHERSRQVWEQLAAVLDEEFPTLLRRAPCAFKSWRSIRASTPCAYTTGCAGCSRSASWRSRARATANLGIRRRADLDRGRPERTHDPWRRAVCGRSTPRSARRNCTAAFGRRARPERGRGVASRILPLPGILEGVLRTALLRAVHYAHRRRSTATRLGEAPRPQRSARRRIYARAAAASAALRPGRRNGGMTSSGSARWRGGRSQGRRGEGADRRRPRRCPNFKAIRSSDSYRGFLDE